MKRSIIILFLIPQLSLLHGCGIFADGYIDHGPPNAEEYYKKPGSTYISVKEDLKKCNYVWPYPKNMPEEIVLNNIIKVEYCMYDKGYVGIDKKTPAYSCKHNYMAETKLPICIARGAYNEK